VTQPSIERTAPAGAGRRRRRRLSGLAILVTAVAALFVAPFVHLALRSLEQAGTLVGEITSPRALASLGRSVMLAAAVSLAAAAIGVAAAWVVTRTDVPGRSAWRVLLPLPLVIPSYIGAFVMIAAFAQGGALESLLSWLGVGPIGGFRGFFGSFVVLSLFTFPYVYLPVQARFRQLPSSLEESARLLGTSPIGTFWSIALPQARSAIVAGALLVFLYTVSDFGVVQLMRYDTLTRVIYSTRLIDSLTSVRLSLMLGVLAIAVVVAERGAARGSLLRDPKRESRPLQYPLGRWRSAAAVFLAGIVGLSLITPVAVCMWWAFRGVVRGDTPAAEFWARAADLARPALNTSVAATAAAVTAVLLVAPVAYFAVRRPGHLGATANAIVVGGFALPGLSIALSLVYFTLSGPSWVGGIYQTLPLLVLAYVIHFGAQALNVATVAVGSVPARVEDAARTLGVSATQRLWRIELPLMLPGLLSGAGLVLLSAMKELPATLLLAPIGFETLSVKIWTGTESALFADASLACLALVLTSGILTWLLVIRRSDTLI
jgi:iron(III) transport system permease protein